MGFVGVKMVYKIVSGGQTGVDRASLDVAAELGLRRGGWCPKGRVAEDGPIPEVYPLTETPTADYRQRTGWNVRDTEATLVLTVGRPEGGTALTVEKARLQGRPCKVVDLSRATDPATVRKWIEQGGYETLNIAGPRESSKPGIYALASSFLRGLFAPYTP
jgi:hypothetical protein